MNNYGIKLVITLSLMLSNSLYALDNERFVESLVKEIFQKNLTSLENENLKNVKVILGSNECSVQAKNKSNLSINPRACALIDERGGKYVIISRDYLHLFENVVTYFMLTPHVWNQNDSSIKDSTNDIDFNQAKPVNQDFSSFISFLPNLESFIEAGVREGIENINKDPSIIRLDNKELEIEFSESNESDREILFQNLKEMVPKLATERAVNNFLIYQNDYPSFGEKEECVAQDLGETRRILFVKSVQNVLNNAYSTGILLLINNRDKSNLQKDDFEYRFNNSKFDICEASNIYSQLIAKVISQKASQRVISSVMEEVFELLKVKINNSALNVQSAFERLYISNKKADAGWYEYTEYATTMYFFNSILVAGKNSTVKYNSAIEVINRNLKNYALDSENSVSNEDVKLTIKPVISFIILHELAHHNLGHIAINQNTTDSIDIESAADAWAQKRLKFSNQDSKALFASALIESVLESARSISEKKLSHPEMSNRLSTFAKLTLLQVENNENDLKNVNSVGNTDKVKKILMKLSGCDGKISLKNCLITD